ASYRYYHLSSLYPPHVSTPPPADVLGFVSPLCPCGIVAGASLPLAFETYRFLLAEQDRGRDAEVTAAVVVVDADGDEVVLAGADELARDAMAGRLGESAAVARRGGNGGARHRPADEQAPHRRPHLPPHIHHTLPPPT